MKMKSEKTKSKKKNYAHIHPNDLENFVTLRKFLSKNIDKIEDNEKIPTGKILTFLKYLEDTLKSQYLGKEKFVEYRSKIQNLRDQVSLNEQNNKKVVP